MIMDIDEAILHCEEVADRCMITDGNIKCGNDHRQLAEWLKELKRLKAAQLEPQKMAKWVKNGNKFICPFCGTSFTTASEEVRSAHKYCYYCGAKMEGTNGTAN